MLSLPSKTQKREEVKEGANIEWNESMKKDMNNE